MTAGNNGADTPENDDPFAYLYRAEGGEGGAPGSPGAGGAARQPGVPRTSYNQVRAVGQRQYGQQAQQPVTYGQQNATYAAPETLPGGDRTRAVPAPGHGGEPEPRRRNGLLIGAVAVVAVVCIGIGVAMLTNNGNDTKNANAGKSGPTAGDTVKPSEQPHSKPKPGELPKEDAGSLRLDGGATTAKDVQGAHSASGSYVTGLNQVGAKVQWTVDLPDAGDYRLYVRYSIPGQDANATLTVNGKPNNQPLGLKNFIHSPEGDWKKGWQSTWAPVTLNKGTNTVEIACAQGNQCNAILDQLWLAGANR
ncbi:CBM35 domain-containing protein [Streptomyces sp. NRRL S-337]|uniref:CBM35 domain-containing protein n=1 Tax=Streptomyces sp. NRRL S-337 TaxID=1463900 RepID=UPI0004C532B7|nr:CBM35 domain-containing protein [Streptomyces sp. NRRL S-337]